MSRFKALSFFLIQLMFVLSACAAQPTPTAAPTNSPVTAVPATKVPAPAVAPAQPVTLTVLAAASLTESFTELGRMFESQNPGVTVAFNFAGSQELAQQLEQGAPADVFASASQKYMDAAIQSGRVTPKASQIFVKNRLVLIFPADNPGALTELRDLANPGLKLDLAHESVPVGKYSLEFLDKATADPAFDPDFKDNVLKNVVSYETSVKAIVSKVSLGEADAGIVYASDITADLADKVGTLAIPAALNTIASYPIAPITDSSHADLARAFVDFILSPAGQQVLEKSNFIPVTN